MKILRFDLLAFGPFTRQSLTLADGEEGLHIVYGPNEAGKTSTLRALRSLLYGFDPRSPDSFLHPYKDLRVGAVLRGPDGAELECIRRKGNKNTLRAGDDAEIVDEARLAHWLGGVTAEGFCQQFGIDHAQLVSGGKEIVAGGGEIGQILFAAASGFAQLHEVRRGLAAEADALFTSRSTDKPINKALTAIKENRQIIQQAQLRPETWVNCHDQLQADEQREKDLESQQRTLGAALARLERIDRACPDISDHERTLRQLDDLRDTPILASDFGGRLAHAEKQWREAELRQQEAVQSIAEWTKEMDGLEVCEAVIARTEFIEPLSKSLAVHQQAEDDSQRILVPQREQLLREAKEILHDLGRDDLDVENADELRLTAEERKRVQRLGGEYASLTERRELSQQRERKLQESLAVLDEELRNLPPSRDTAPLRHTLARLQKQGGLATRLVQLEKELKRVQKQAQIDLKKLPLWDRSLEALEAIPLPSPETISQFEQRLDEARNEVKRLAEQLADARRQLEDTDEKLRQLGLQQDVPTEEDLAAARARRDEGWRLIRAALRSEKVEDAALYIAAFADAESLEAAFEKSVQQADEVADRLRREAERVGVKSQLMAQRAKQEQRLEDLTAELESADGRQKQCRVEWTQQWQPAGIEPLSPREMRAWTARHGELVAAVEAIREQSDEANSVRLQIEKYCGELHECLAKLDIYPEWTNSHLDDLVAMSEAVLEEAEFNENQRRQLDRDAARQRREFETASDDVRQARSALQQWRVHWTEATQRLRLRDDSDPNVANEVLTTIENLFDKIHKAKALTVRIEAIAVNAERFAHNVKNVCNGAAPDLVGLPYATATTELHQRLEKAKKARDRLADLQKQQASAQKRLEASQQQLLTAQAELDALCKEAGCKSPGELRTIERQAQQKRELQRRLEEIEARLHREAAGKTLADFVQEALSEDPDQLPTTIARLRQQIQDGADELRRTRDRMIREKLELENMDGNARAADAQEMAEQLLAQLRDDAERYVRLRLAAEVLHHAIQRYREKNQGPVLSRASELFQALTLGSFRGLKVDYNEAGQPVLVGQRDSGQSVRVDGMSDGSCDQLYLALRLASLEHYLDDHPPLPFIVDDILITFDDDRAVAALRALGELSRRTQVIFFTHHRRLVELARKHLPKRTLFVHQLPGPLGPPAADESQEEPRERTLFA